MEDYLVRAIAKEFGVRALTCDATQLVEEARQRHGTAPTATVALGRALIAVALMGALLRSRQRVALKYEGNGPLRKIVVECNEFGTVRGYVATPEVDLPPTRTGEPDVVSALGHAGLLTVVKDLRLKELQEGVVHLHTSEIDSDLEAYLELSEQIPSAVELGVVLAEDGSVAHAGGLLVQSLPPYDPDAMAQLKNRIQELPPIETLLSSGKIPENLLELLMAEEVYEVLEERPLTFRCTCSRSRSERALLMLGADELQHVLDNEGQAHVDCNFCHESYVFTRAEVEDLIVLLRNAGSVAS